MLNLLFLISIYLWFLKVLRIKNWQEKIMDIT